MESECPVSMELPLPRHAGRIRPIEGARNLGVADRVGSLTSGKRADLILVRTTDLNTAPRRSAPEYGQAKLAIATAS